MGFNSGLKGLNDTIVTQLWKEVNVYNETCLFWINKYVASHLLFFNTSCLSQYWAEGNEGIYSKGG
jgi:hypothetical protein